MLSIVTSQILDTSIVANVSFNKLLKNGMANSVDTDEMSRPIEICTVCKIYICIGVTTAFLTDTGRSLKHLRQLGGVSLENQTTSTYLTDTTITFEGNIIYQRWKILTYHTYSCTCDQSILRWSRC